MTKNLHFAHFFVTGFAYYEGCLVFNDLKIGTQLKLVREAENRHDPDAIAVHYGDSKLGFIPRGENDIIAKLLDQGYADAFDVRCNRVMADASPNHQVGVTIFLKQNKN